MNKFRNALIAALALAAVVTAGIEVLGIEVLGIEVLANGSSNVEIQVTPIPPTGYAEAIMYVSGQPVVVDTQPLNAAGQATVNFPMMVPGNEIAVVGGNGAGLIVWE